MFRSSYATPQPKGLRKVVLAKSPASIELWIESIQGLRSELPEDDQKAIDKAGIDENTESPSIAGG